MKRKLFLSLLIVSFTVSLVGCNQNTSKEQNQTQEQASVSEKNLKENYGLDEKCGKRSEEWFKNKYGNSDETGNLSYQNHYNKKMNKCFILVTKETGIITSEDYVQNQYLFDVNENKEYGFVLYLKGMTQHTCSFLGKKCDYWYSEINPYIEE